MDEAVTGGRVAWATGRHVRAVTFGGAAGETGIMAAALDDVGNCYFLEDISGRFRPDEWAPPSIAWRFLDYYGPRAQSLWRARRFLLIAIRTWPCNHYRPLAASVRT